jgi:homoserine O-acetyltransferase/O-succinyltransferase
MDMGEAAAQNADPLPGFRVRLGRERPLQLDCGAELRDFPVAYQTYGQLNADKSNLILVCHALTGDQFVAETHPITGKPGWWEIMVGSGKPLDTDRYCILCVNVLGGCMGSSGPSEINPETGEPWGLSFPVISIADMVRAQALLLDHLGVARVFAVIGGSMGGMQVLEWASLFPERVFAAVPIATSALHSAQNIAFHEVGRQAIMADPDWCGGDYWRHGKTPHRGLAVARMAAHITYLSEPKLTEKFGRRLHNRSTVAWGFDADFQVESYLRHQGISFVERFDANSYLYITRAMDYFDMAERHGGVLANAFRGTPVRFCVISFTSDWLYPTPENRRIVKALNAVAANVSFAEIVSNNGHDAFLLDEPELHRVLAGFLSGAASHWGLASHGGPANHQGPANHPAGAPAR